MGTQECVGTPQGCRGRSTLAVPQYRAPTKSIYYETLLTVLHSDCALPKA